VQTPVDRLEVTAEFLNIRPTELFDFWIRPDLLKRWWPPEVEIESHLGGHYHFSWPKQGWHLRGMFTEFEEGKRLGFTWRWDHEPNDETRVEIFFEPPRAGWN